MYLFYGDLKVRVTCGGLKFTLGLLFIQKRLGILTYV